MSEPIRFSCDCGRQLNVSGDLAGKRIRCPECRVTLDVPRPSVRQRKKQPPSDVMLCDYCHEYIPRAEYDSHVDKHLRLRSDGQQMEHATLPPEARDDSLRPEDAPRWYRHRKCGAVTGMPEDIIATYLTNPWFYLSEKTFCTGCGTYVHHDQCVWEETGEDLGIYTRRLREAKPEYRPGPFRLALAWLLNRF